MRLLLLITLLLASLIINAQDEGLEKKQITLDLRPDFNDELKHQDKIAKDKLLSTTDNQTEEKNIFDKPPPPRHTFNMSVGVATGKAFTQDGVEPITSKPLKPKMNTFFEK